VFFGFHDLTAGLSGWVFGFFGLKNSDGTFSDKLQAAWLDDTGALQESGDVTGRFTHSFPVSSPGVSVAFRADGSGGCAYQFTLFDRIIIRLSNRCAARAADRIAPQAIPRNTG
jgi:hypothetical protein